MELERKIYQDLLEWKNRSGGKSALLIAHFGAIVLPRKHPFSIGFTGKATKRIRGVYDYVWTEDNS